MREIQVQLKTEDLEMSTKRVEAYLYSNFEVAQVSTCLSEFPDTSTLIILGEDVAGWTAEVQADRLASGMIFAKVTS